jgi:hypothetical protein
MFILFYYCQTVASLLVWGALSDERTGLSFTTAAGPRQRSHFRVRVPWDSWPYFTVSDSRFPFSSPPTTRRTTVEVFEPASTRDTPIRLANTSPFITLGESYTAEHSTQQYVYLLSWNAFVNIHCRGNKCLPSCCLALDIHVTIWRELRFKYHTTKTYRPV